MGEGLTLPRVWPLHSAPSAGQLCPGPAGSCPCLQGGLPWARPGVQLVAQGGKGDKHLLHTHRGPGAWLMLRGSRGSRPASLWGRRGGLGEWGLSGIPHAGLSRAPTPDPPSAHGQDSCPLLRHSRALRQNLHLGLKPQHAPVALLPWQRGGQLRIRPPWLRALSSQEADGSRAAGQGCGRSLGLSQRPALGAAWPSQSSLSSHLSCPTCKRDICPKP